MNIIEQAIHVLATSDIEGPEWERESAQALANAGLLTQTTPSRDEIATTIRAAANTKQSGMNIVPIDAATNAVHALLKDHT